MPTYHKSIFSRHEEQVGRHAMPTDMMFGDNETNEDDELQLRHDLK
jgi:hypothetical protein